MSTGYKKRLEKIIEEKKDSQEPGLLDFLKSLQRGLEKWGNLTEKQENALKKIEQLSTPAAKREAQDWLRAYPSEFRSDAIVCAKYYLANPPYFQVLAKEILNNPSFIPTKSQFEALTTNQYAKRVLEEYHRQPIYNNGDLVQFRDMSSMPYYLTSFKGRPCVVVDNKSNFITTHAKGAKTYKLLPIGKRTSLLCQERWIKNFRNKTKKDK